MEKGDERASGIAVNEPSGLALDPRSVLNYGSRADAVTDICCTRTIHIGVR